MPPQKPKSAPEIISASKAFSSESNLKRRLRKHFTQLGFRQEGGMLLPPQLDKEQYRFLHREQRLAKLEQSRDLLEECWPAYKGYFAHGAEVRPTKLQPRLELVHSRTWQNDLFRIATMSWSVPVSQGFGRRLRYLVWDDHNDKLIGVLALGDPVFNLAARDQAIGWSTSDRSERLVNILDAFVLGALPPYNMLLCGKMITCLIRSRDVVGDFKRKYSTNTGIISGKMKSPKLVAVTTTSSLGRSSVYNRLSLEGIQYFAPVGFSEGFGHFQVPNEIFEDMRALLDAKGHKYAHGHQFGDGPNWRLRTIRKALGLIGMSEGVIKHNLKREVFLCRLAKNADSILQGTAKRPDYSDLKSVSEIAELCRKRWIVPRAARCKDFKAWKRDWVRERLILTGSSAPSEGGLNARRA